MKNTGLETEVLIVGGGMVGLALGIALGQAGTRTVLVDREAPQAMQQEQFDGRVSAIARSSQRLMAALGAWDGMAKEAEPIQDIRVTDDDSHFFLHFDHREVDAAPFGYIVENRHIRRALQSRAERCENLTLLAPMKIEGVTRDTYKVQATLGDGRCVRSALVIAADGKQSTLRRLAGIGTLEADYDQTAIVATIAHTLPHGGLAQERFFPAGPFAILPMTGNRCSLVWVEPRERAAAYIALNDEMFSAEIQRRVGGYLGEVTPVGPRFTYPLSLLHARRYTDTRLALIGDAAHAIHPIAGQGVNLGWRDVAVLAERITEAKRLGLDIGSAPVLQSYERWRRFDNMTMMAVTDTLNRLFSTSLLPVRAARRMGLWGVAQMPPLKRFFMRHAMGLTGELPKLLRGEAL